jgi:hypothetical protein
VIVLDPVAVTFVTLSLPKEVTFVFPIKPPFVDPAGCAI